MITNYFFYNIIFFYFILKSNSIWKITSLSWLILHHERIIFNQKFHFLFIFWCSKEFKNHIFICLLPCINNSTCCWSDCINLLFLLYNNWFCFFFDYLFFFYFLFFCDFFLNLFDYLFNFIFYFYFSFNNNFFLF